MKPANRNTTKLINVIGIDGAGKTTLAVDLAETMGKTDSRVRYCYSQYFAKLLYPVKRLAGLIFMKNTNEFNDYRTYNRTKQSTSSRYPFLAGIYAFIWLLDYTFQVFFKITIPILLGRRLVIDRYIIDIAVNLSLTLNRDVAFARRLIHRFLTCSKSPDLILYIDLPEEIAFSRKDDIQDIDYLTERRERYLALANEFGFVIIDGTMSQEKVLEAALSAIENKERSSFNPLKTILYVHANNTDIGGADYCLFKLAAALDRKKFRALVCLSRKTEILDLYEQEGIETRIIAMERIKKSFNPFYLGRLALNFFPTVRTLRTIIRNENVDLVHGNDLLDVYGPVAGMLENIPTTQYVRWILESPTWLKRLITRIVYHINHRVMTVSNGVAITMFAPDGIVLPKVVTSYDWMDMAAVGHKEKSSDIREEYQIPAKAPLVGCVGRLEAWKGQDVFIRSAAAVLKQIPDARFLVVGGTVDGRGRESYGDRCKSLTRELGISSRIIFTGHRSDISAVMNSLDVFVHASVSPDPLPGVVMEAMASNTPVVGADAGGVPEEMENRVTGLLYPPGDADHMAANIIWMLEHPGEAAGMGRAGYQRVNDLFNKVNLCRHIEQIYETMIQHNNRTGGQTLVSRHYPNSTPATMTGKGLNHVQNI